MTARARKPRNNRKSPVEAGQAKPTAPAAPGSRARHMELVLQKGQTEDRATAEAALSPELPNASTAADYSLGLFSDIRLQDCIDTMQADIKAVNGGNLDKLEGMLTAQAGALNVMFNTFAKRAIHADVMPRLETYFRLALKAQAQCRATVEAIAEIKYPKSATFIRQANIAQQQQVNNSGPFPYASHAHAQEKNVTPTNELLEVSHGERLDGGATSTAGGTNSDVATVGAVYRACDEEREGNK